MPREIVVAAKTEGPGQAEVQVHWSRDKYVQLSVQRFWSEPKVPIGIDADLLGSKLSPNAAVWVLPNDPQPSDSTFHSEEPIWTGELTRSEINNFIRVLRRARDQVHGRDE